MTSRCRLSSSATRPSCSGRTASRARSRRTGVRTLIDMTSRRRSRAVSMRRSSTWPSASTTASVGASDGSETTTTPWSARPDAATLWATDGCRRTRGSLRPGRTASTRRTVSALWSSATASSRPTSSRVSSNGQLRCVPGNLVGQLGQGLVEADGRLLERGDRGAVLGLAAGLGGGDPLLVLLGGQACGLVGLAAALGPADGVPLGVGGRTGALGERGQGLLGRDVAEHTGATQSGPHAGAQLGGGQAGRRARRRPADHAGLR